MKSDVKAKKFMMLCNHGDRLYGGLDAKGQNWRVEMANRADEVIAGAGRKPDVGSSHEDVYGDAHEPSDPFGWSPDDPGRRGADADDSVSSGEWIRSIIESDPASTYDKMKEDVELAKKFKAAFDEHDIYGELDAKGQQWLLALINLAERVIDRAAKEKRKSGMKFEVKLVGRKEEFDKRTRGDIGKPMTTDDIVGTSGFEEFLGRYPDVSA
jgi:hypothetical protein